MGICFIEGELFSTQLFSIEKIFINFHRRRQESIRICITSCTNRPHPRRALLLHLPTIRTDRKGISPNPNLPQPLTSSAPIPFPNLPSPSLRLHKNERSSLLPPPLRRRQIWSLQHHINSYSSRYLPMDYCVPITYYISMW
jgi:hypothetical protein